jgi:hypothetical protein
MFVIKKHHIYDQECSRNANYTTRLSWLLPNATSDAFVYVEPISQNMVHHPVVSQDCVHISWPSFHVTASFRAVAAQMPATEAPVTKIIRSFQRCMRSDTMLHHACSIGQFVFVVISCLC